MSTATIKKARSIERRYGSNYYLATLFLPKTVREAVFVLYAFVRIPDEIVDNPDPGSNPTALLEAWKSEWEETYQTGNGSNDIMLATRELFLTYHIPFSISIEFIAAMQLDLHKHRYETYDELKTYMRGSAEVVGIMLTKIFGCTDETALPYAEKLGEAMQFTNFLRDSRDDYVTRKRIYLPQADLHSFGVTEAQLAQAVPSTEYKALMKFEIQRARALFREAEPGINLLPPYARRAVTLAAKFYEGILDTIEKNQYAPPLKPVSLSPLQKCKIVISTYVNK